jgi:hypothetical protein
MIAIETDNVMTGRFQIQRRRDFFGLDSRDAADPMMVRMPGAGAVAEGPRRASRDLV